MPVMPGYIHADVPHEKTVTGAGYRYGCNSERTEDLSPRGKPTTYIAAKWAKPQTVMTEWLAKSCGHDLRDHDPACTGCTNRNQQL